MAAAYGAQLMASGSMKANGGENGVSVSKK